MALTRTPRSNQLHIGIYGKRNSGKSSLLNALTNQDAAMVSEVAGTTTDPVYKTMEIHGIGPCVFIDTPGFDDEGTLGELRVERTKQAVEKTDLAFIVCSDSDITQELQWKSYLRERDIPVVMVINKKDTAKAAENLKKKIDKQYDGTVIISNAAEKSGMEEIRQAILKNIPEGYEKNSIVGELADQNDVVLLVMPQDIQAPKGRLILPQVQTIRDLLDKKCIIMNVTLDQYENGLKHLSTPPKLIITDSQVFDKVYKSKPKESMITSFSVLFANYKGDISYYIESAKKIDQLTEESRVLIAEACTHAPLKEDIGREQIPAMLRKRIGEGLRVDVVCGTDFPEDLTSYSLIIQCGGCMFNRRYMLSRVNRAKKQGIPITNYGIVIAFMKNILDSIVY